jgi:TRAP-type mannitol/chloroaromatic compound transport system permease small subunit
MENRGNIFLRNIRKNLYICVEQSQKARIKIAAAVVVVVVVVVPVAVIWYNNNNNNNNNNQMTLQQYMYQSIFL